MDAPTLEFLHNMSADIFRVAGIFALPLITIIVFRAARLGGLNEENMAERLTDNCLNTIKEKISEQIEALLRQTFNTNVLILPQGMPIPEIVEFLHGGNNSLERLLPILKNLTEVGANSSEFQSILGLFFVG